jgi:hypothetical protein
LGRQYYRSKSGAPAPPESPSGGVTSVIYSILGLVVFAGLTMVNFQRLPQLN